MTRPPLPYAYAIQPWTAEHRATLYSLGARLSEDPRPLDERTPHVAAPFGFLLLAAVGIVAVLGLFIGAVAA